MSWATIVMIAGVFVVGGCTQNGALNSKTSDTQESTIPVQMPFDASGKAPDISLNAEDFKTKFPESVDGNALPNAAGAIDIEETEEIADEADMIPAPIIKQETRGTPVATSVTTSAFNPIPAPGSPSNVNIVTTPTGGTVTMTGSGTVAVVLPGQNSVQMTVKETESDEVETLPWYQRALDALKATIPAAVEAVAATAATGVTTTPVAKPPVTAPVATATPRVSPTSTPTVIAPTAAVIAPAAPVVSTNDGLAVTQTVGNIKYTELKVIETEAFTQELGLLLMKLKSLHAETAALIEAQLKQTRFVIFDGDNGETLAANKSELLVSDFPAQALDNMRMLQLKDAVLISNFYYNAATPRGQATILLKSALLRLAVQTATTKDKTFMNAVSSLSETVAAKFLAQRQTLNQRMVYENLRTSQVSVANWQFEQLTMSQTRNEIAKLSARKFSVVSMKPIGHFSLQTAPAGTNAFENCGITVNSQNDSAMIVAREPEWREFEVDLNLKSTEKLPLRPSLAGDNFVDLEVLKKLEDKTSLRLTIRYSFTKNAMGSERKANMIIMEQLPVKGAATKTLMCRVLPQTATAEVTPEVVTGANTQPAFQNLLIKPVPPVYRPTATPRPRPINPLVL